VISRGQSGAPTCVSVTVAVLGARGLDREMVYMMSLVWFPASSFFHGWYTTSAQETPGVVVVVVSEVKRRVVGEYIHLTLHQEMRNNKMKIQF